MEARTGILPQRRQSLALERIEGVQGPVPERVVREEAEAHVAMLAIDDVAEFQRERSRNGNRARHGRIVRQHLGLFAAGDDAFDHIGGVVVADAVDHRRQVVGLIEQRLFGQVAHVEPDRDRQAGQDHQHQQHGDEKPASQAPDQPIASGGGLHSLWIVLLRRGSSNVCGHLDLALPWRCRRYILPREARLVANEKAWI